MYSKEEVLKFIKEFESVSKFFLYGKCYWFAIILKERFSGRMMYNPIYNHWAVRIGDLGLFDASGEIEPRGYSNWPCDFLDDELHYNRLVKQCIEFKGE